MKDYGQLCMELRESHGGLMETGLKTTLENQDDLSTLYTPGIAEPCRQIHKDINLSKKLTIRKNTVAVITNGTAVLGLGEIGPEAGLPVMEGKCMLFKHFGNVDGVPIAINSKDPQEIIQTIKNIAPSFGGINLEDIAAPHCFEIEKALIEALDIPVFHDDQHGTAIVVLAALINALKVTEKKVQDLKITLVGSGAAGIAITNLLKKYGVKNMVLVDSKGIVSTSREDLNEYKKAHAVTETGTLEDAVKNSDVFIGVSKPGLLTQEMVKTMAKNPIIFAMSNPIPEILPEEAHAAGAAIVATGTSQYPNQINNVLAFPGLFRGLFDKEVTTITDEIKIRAAEGLASLVKAPTPEKIIPFAFDEGVSEAVAASV